MRVLEMSSPVSHLLALALAIDIDVTDEHRYAPPMRAHLSFSAFCLVASTFLGGLPARADGCRLAVTTLEAQGLSDDDAHLAQALTDSLTTAVADASGCDVMSSADMAAIAGFEAQKAMCGLASDACLAELGSALGVDRMVSGTVVRLGGATTVTARLLNIKDAKVEARAEATSTDVADLRSKAREVGLALFGVVAKEPNGPSELTVVGGVAAGLGLLTAAVGGLIALEADGVLGIADAPAARKEEAQDRGTLGLTVAGVGAVVLVVGTVFATVGLLTE